MAPAILNEVSSAANAAANGLDDIVAGQDHLKDTGNELEALPGEPDKENAVGRSANEDHPFDSDSDSDGDDDEFMPRGRNEDPTKSKSSQKKFVPTKVEKNNPNLKTEEAEKPKDAEKEEKNVKAAKTAK